MRLKPLLAINALSVVGNGCMAVQPIVVGALVDRLGFSESQAGFVAAVEMAGVGAGFLLLVPVAHRIGQQKLALYGLAVIALANLTACAIHSFDFMLLAAPIVRYTAKTIELPRSIQNTFLLLSTQSRSPTRGCFYRSLQ